MPKTLHHRDIFLLFLTTPRPTMPRTLDPEIATALVQRVVPPEALQPIPVGDVITRRALHETALAQTDTSLAPGTFTKDFRIPSKDGTPIICRWYTATSSAPSERVTAAVLYLHGGGHILGNVHLFNGVCSRYVAHTSVPILSVDYRLAPEYPFPHALEDVFAALLYLSTHAHSLGIDAQRIAVMGDSAGGGLAAALAHYTLHMSGPRIAKQLLIYPMLDDLATFSSPDYTELSPFLTWTAADNSTAWTALLGSPSQRGNLPPWAAPARMKTVPEGMPPVYIEIASLDLFRAENEAYAARLAEAGVPVRVERREGCPHGWEHIAPAAQVTQRAMADRWGVIREL